MGREIRMVPKGWQHPRGYNGHYQPLRDGYAKDFATFEAKAAKEGLREACAYFGGGVNEDDYMLVDVPDSERTHLMMYEDTSEGTPISPAFETPEELARWLADSGASAFGGMTATYEQWLRTCKSGWAPSAVFDGQLKSGVEGF